MAIDRLYPKILGGLSNQMAAPIGELEMSGSFPFTVEGEELASSMQWC